MTDIPTIVALPAPPQRGQDPAIFIQRADSFIDALAAFVAQMNAFGAQLVTATQERVVNQAAGSYNGALAARDAALAARDAAQAYAASVDPANLVHRTGNETVAGTKNFTDVIQLAGKALTLAATYAEASTAEMLANTAARLVSVQAMWASMVPVALVDAATIAVNLAAGINFTVTVTANRILGNPTNVKPGQQGSIFVTQGGAGGFVLSFGSAYVPDDLINYPSLNTAAGSVTELRYKVAADGKVRLYGGKPAITFRQQTLIAGPSNTDDVYFAVEDQTVKYSLRSFGAAVARLSVLSSDGINFSNPSVVVGSGAPGNTGNITLAAGQALQLTLTNSNGGFFMACHVQRIS